MALDQRMSQQLRQQQRLVMTPMMQQAIKLLQLSTLELQELVQQELMENVVLEEDNDAAEPGEVGEDALPQLESDELSLAETNGKHDNEPDLSRGEIDASQEIAEYFADTTDYDYVAAPSTYEAAYDDYEPQIVRAETLKEHLTRQLHLVAANEDELAAGERIIDLIDDDGYFQGTIEQVAEETGVDPDIVDDALGLVQAMDPPGVGARDIKECLLLQYRAGEHNDPLLRQAIAEHLENLERKRFQVVARALGITEQRAQELADVIGTFEPFPGRAYGEVQTEYILPDVFIEKIGGEWQVRVNDDGAPPLRISRRYRQMLQDRDQLTPQEYDFLLEKFRSARWLIRNIEQRKQTLYKVTKYIADVQSEFLEHGISHLRPLRYRDVADGVGIHEATVCRVVNNKYAQTPRGLFELKFFFSTGLEVVAGDQQSAKAIMEKIKDFIDAEDPYHPLSDQKIMKMLAEHVRGVKISRRTVAKYRQKMGILPAHQRKRV